MAALRSLGATKRTVAALKAAFNVHTDMALADALDVNRSAVSKWWERGAPELYVALAQNPDALRRWAALRLQMKAVEAEVRK